MKGNKGDLVCLRHILDAIGFIEEFSKSKGKEDIYNNFMYRFSVERQLEIIGEAANNISSGIQLYQFSVCRLTLKHISQ